MTATRRTPLPAAAEGRIEMIDELLLASGWTRSGEAFDAPPHLADRIAALNGRGAWSREYVIAWQVQADQALLAYISKEAAAVPVMPTD